MRKAAHRLPMQPEPSDETQYILGLTHIANNIRTQVKACENGRISRESLAVLLHAYGAHLTKRKSTAPSLFPENDNVKALLQERSMI